MNKLKSLILKLLPTLIIAYTAWGVYDAYILHQDQLNQKNSVIQGLEGKIGLAQIKLKKIKRFKENLQKSKDRISVVNNQIKKVQTQLPTNISDPIILESIQDQANVINIKEVELSPKDETVNGFYISKNYEMKGVGTYLQFLIFFERLASSDRLFNVKEVVIRNEGVKQKGRFTLVQGQVLLESFKYNSSYVQESGVEEIEQKYQVR